MDEKQKIDEALGICFSDWDGDFVVSIEEEEGCWSEATIKHEQSGTSYEMYVRYKNGKCQFDVCDGVWENIDMETVFSWMWFQEAFSS